MTPYLSKYLIPCHSMVNRVVAKPVTSGTLGTVVTPCSKCSRYSSTKLSYCFLIIYKHFILEQLFQNKILFISNKLVIG